jgi:hypothetical protein
MAPRLVNKSAFVRDLGDIPVRDIIAKAKERGFKLTPAHVYTIRAAAKRKAGGRSTGLTRRPGRIARGEPTHTTLRSTLDNAAQRFVDAILTAFRSASLDDLLGRGGA